MSHVLTAVFSKVVLQMAFRLFIGGLPAWVDHETVIRWTWHHTGIRASVCQIVRKWNGETLVSAFLGFRTNDDMAWVLRTMPGILFWGYRVTWRVSRDSRVEAPAATPPRPMAPSSPAVPVVPSVRSQQASAPASADAHMEGQVQTQGTNSMPHSKESLPSAEAAAAVEAKVEQQGLNAAAPDPKVVEPRPLSGEVEVEAKESKTSLVSNQEAECKEPLPSGEDKTLMEPVLAAAMVNSECDGQEDDDKDTDTLQMSPTEKASSPTEDEAPTAQASEEAPTVMESPETREKMNLQKNLVKCKEEIQEIQEELKEEIQED